MRFLRLNGNDEVSLIERRRDDVTAYAILSHTWGPDEDEVTFEDMVMGTGKNKPGYAKIEFCARQAKTDGLEYCWLDTCCINKANFTELSEAINSMFRWYREATQCYVYFSDVPDPQIPTSTEESAFPNSRWFKRGWTLQELIASPSVQFFSREGKPLGTKASRELELLQITGIAVGALRGAPLSQFSAAERLSWARERQTTVEEDAAYCLLGIFDIQMPLIYGEGRQKALDRLQRKMQRSHRASIRTPPYDRNPTDGQSTRLNAIRTQLDTLQAAFGSNSIKIDWEAEHKMAAPQHAMMCSRSPQGAGNRASDWVAPESDSTLEHGTDITEPKLVKSHKSFGDWLSTFATGLGQAAITAEEEEIAEYRRQKGLTPKSKDSNTVGVASTPLPAKSLGGGSELPDPPSGSSAVSLIISGLKRSHPDKRFTETISTTVDTPLYKIIHQLMEKGEHEGYQTICGLQDQGEQLIFPPMVPFSLPLSIAITAEESCYSIAEGLKINRQQKLVDFYNRYLESCIGCSPEDSFAILKRDTSVEVMDYARQVKSNISFNRTLRVPEDGKRYPLPALFGGFSLLNVDNYLKELPEVFAKKGGVFLPMFQREGLALQFDASKTVDRYPGSSWWSSQETNDECFAVKVHTGSINCVSGRKVEGKSTVHEQDYIVSPNQIRLDGFRTGTGKVQQFVAMPFGLGYSVEKQVTGTEFIGGLQLQIATRLSNNVEFSAEHGESAFERSLDLFRSPKELGLQPNTIIQMRATGGDMMLGVRKVKFDLGFIENMSNSQPYLFPLAKDKCRPTFVWDLVHAQVPRNGDCLCLKPVPPLSLTFDWREMALEGRPPSEDYSPFLDISEFKKQVASIVGRNAIPWRHGYLTFSGRIHKGYPTEYIPLKNVVPADGVISFLADGSARPMPGRPMHYGASGRDNGPTKTEGWEMVLGAGGTLNQYIRRTTDERLWDWSNSRFFNVQILNSVAFKSVTGIAPWSPISFQDYISAKLPFYSFVSGENAPVLSGFAPRFKTISELDGGKDIRLGVRLGRDGSVIVCLNCEQNICDTLLQPCKHIWCADCIRSHMSGNVGIKCAFCDGKVSATVKFSATMESPKNKEVTVCSSVASTLPSSNSPSKENLDAEMVCSTLRASAPREFKYLPEWCDTPTKKVLQFADSIMLNQGTNDKIRFSMLISLLRNAHRSVRLSFVHPLLRCATADAKPFYVQGLLTLISCGADMMEENGYLLSKLLKTVAKREDGDCFRELFNWTVMTAQPLRELGITASDLVIASPVGALGHVIHHLETSGKSLSDQMVSVFDALGPEGRIASKVRLLVKHGCDINARDAQGRTIVTCVFDRASIIQPILKLGAHANILDADGNGPLHVAIIENRGTLLEELLDHKTGRIAVNVRNADGLTPFHLALMSTIHARRKLLKAKADPHIRIPDGPFRDNVQLLAASLVQGSEDAELSKIIQSALGPRPAMSFWKF